MLGERIALLRRGKGWNQLELANRLHISASAVGMYEQGRREPSLAGIVELAAVFGVSKSTVHKDLTERLLNINPALAAEARRILDMKLSQSLLYIYLYM